LTYKNNDDEDDVEVLLLLLLLSLSLFRKKEMATPKLSVRFMRNLFFLSIGALPTATRCTLIFGLFLITAGEEGVAGLIGAAGVASFCCCCWLSTAACCCDVAVDDDVSSVVIFIMRQLYCPAAIQ